MNIELLVGFGVLGLVIGSFLNVVIYRLPVILKDRYREECLTYLNYHINNSPRKLGISLPLSFCPDCYIPLKWWHKIPLLSYLILGGKCYFCKAEISRYYPLVEGITAVTTLIVVSFFGVTSIKVYLALVFTWYLLVITVIDIKHQLLPDCLTLSLLWIGLLANSAGVFVDPVSAIIGAAGGYSFLWIIAGLFRWVRKAEGIGYGDFKLLAALGGWFGWQLLLPIILGASLLGGMLGLILTLNKNISYNQPIPFGPFLAVFGWLSLFGLMTDGILLISWWNFHV